MSTEPYVPSEMELVQSHAFFAPARPQDMDVRAKAAERGIAKIKADAHRSLLEELLADAELEARIGRQGDDDERVNAAEKIIEMLNDTQIEEEA